MNPRSEHNPRIIDALILSHGTAQSYYLTLDPKRNNIARPSMDNPLPCADALSRTFEGVNTNYAGFGNGPFEVLVPQSELRRSRSGLITHCSSLDLPKGSFWKFRTSLYISSPELCFVQMANKLSQARLVELGINLCAKYYLHPRSGEIFEREPITTVAKLKAYLERIDSSYHGVRNAQRALKWVVDNTASPMESRCAILIHYSKRYGGCGFPLIEANHRVNPGSFKHLAEQGYFEIDGCWPDKFTGYEYLGDKEHQDLAKDMRRIDALSALGWHIVTFNKKVCYNPDAFDVAVRQLARHMRIRIRRQPDWSEKMLELRRELGLLDDTPHYFEEMHG